VGQLVIWPWMTCADTPPAQVKTNARIKYFIYQ
jgi:hypothetical protein